MPHRDLTVIKQYLHELSVSESSCVTEIEQIIVLLDVVGNKCKSINPSITLARKSVSNCGICKKRVLVDG